MTQILLQNLDRSQFRLSLALMRVEGVFLRQMPRDVEIFPLWGKRLWVAWWSLARVLRQQQPDIVFSTSGGMNLAAVLAWILAGRNPRLVLSERSILLRDGTWKRRLMQRLKAWLYPLADEITTVSWGVKKDLVRHLKLDPGQLSVVFNPIVTDDLERLAAEPIEHPWLLAQDVPVLLAVGRFVEQKDYPVLLKAFAMVRVDRQARLLILGKGPLEGELRQWIRDLGIDEDVSLAGYDVNPFRYMARATIYVLSSKHEGLPGVLIQAMACGAAVISTDCPSGPSEIITSGRDGILVPVGDIAGLAREIHRLLDDHGLRRQLGDAARQSVQRFRVDRVMRRYVGALVP